MSVTLIMAVALKFVLTHFALMESSHVHVTQDMYCILMASLALVSKPSIHDNNNAFIGLDIDECALDTDTCQQVCINTNGSYTCSCMEGCSLDANGNTCSGNCCSFYCSYYYCHYFTDINECESANPRLFCDQTCANRDCTDGRYQCSCNSGYILNLNNNKTCLGELKCV